MKIFQVWSNWTSKSEALKKHWTLPQCKRNAMKEKKTPLKFQHYLAFVRTIWQNFPHYFHFFSHSTRCPIKFFNTLYFRVIGCTCLKGSKSCSSSSSKSKRAFAMGWSNESSKLGRGLITYSNNNNNKFKWFSASISHPYCDSVCGSKDERKKSKVHNVQALASGNDKCQNDDELLGILFPVFDWPKHFQSLWVHCQNGNRWQTIIIIMTKLDTAADFSINEQKWIFGK